MLKIKANTTIMKKTNILRDIVKSILSKLSDKEKHIFIDHIRKNVPSAIKYL